ncbi:hypothetical protein L7F22_002776 [Adiantum nelumboides]|nr:hypothetical protein [Adiantum nelumboides]
MMRSQPDSASDSQELPRTSTAVVVQFSEVQGGFRHQPEAAPYFNKIQCFCFEEQRLRPGEKIDMPVFFYIDPEFATDPKMGNINNLILSYTFFKVDDEESSSKD